MNYGSKVRRGVAFTFLFAFLGGVFGLLFRILLARSLSPTEYGLFFAVYALVFFLYSFQDLGMGSALMRFIPEWIVKKQEQKINQGIFQVLGVQLAVSIFLIIILFAFRVPLTENYFSEPRAYAVLIVLLFAILFEPFLTNSAYVFTAFQASGYALSINAIRILFVLIASFILLQAGFGVLSPAIAYAVSALILGPAYLYLFKQKFFSSLSFPKNINKDILKKLSSYGKYFILSSVAALLLANTDTLMITFFLDVTQTGIYSVALTLASLVISVGSLLFMIILPLASHMKSSKNNSALQELIRSIYKYFFIFSLPFIGIVIAFPNEIITLFFGSEYISASTSLQLNAVGALAYSLGLINLAVLSGIGKAKVQSKILIIISLANIVMNIVLIPRLGIAGAATASLIAYCTALMLSVFAIRREVNVSIPWRSWALNLFILIFSIFCLEISRKYLPWNNIQEVIFLGGVFIILYFVLCLATGLIRISEIKRIINLTISQKS